MARSGTCSGRRRPSRCARPTACAWRATWVVTWRTRWSGRRRRTGNRKDLPGGRREGEGLQVVGHRPIAAPPAVTAAAATTAASTLTATCAPCACPRAARAGPRPNGASRAGPRQPGLLGPPGGSRAARVAPCREGAGRARRAGVRSLVHGRAGGPSVRRRREGEARDAHGGGRPGLAQRRGGPPERVGRARLAAARAGRLPGPPREGRHRCPPFSSRQ